jgi:hypothetical protein
MTYIKGAFIAKLRRKEFPGYPKFTLGIKFYLRTLQGVSLSSGHLLA